MVLRVLQTDTRTRISSGRRRRIWWCHRNPNPVWFLAPITSRTHKAGLDKKVKGKKEHDNDLYILTDCINTYELLLFKKQHADGCPAIIEKQLMKAGIVLNNWIKLTKDLMRQDPEHKNPELSEDELRQAEFTYEKLKQLVRETILHHRSVNPTNLQ